MIALVFHYLKKKHDQKIANQNSTAITRDQRPAEKDDVLEQHWPGLVVEPAIKGVEGGSDYGDMGNAPPPMYEKAIGETNENSEKEKKLWIGA